eukprot:363806-Chlamydomonas_euryale.AAC.5
MRGCESFDQATRGCEEEGRGKEVASACDSGPLPQNMLPGGSGGRREEVEKERQERLHFGCMLRLHAACGVHAEVARCM